MTPPPLSPPALILDRRRSGEWGHRSLVAAEGPLEEVGGGDKLRARHQGFVRGASRTARVGAVEQCLAFCIQEEEGGGSRRPNRRVWVGGLARLRVAADGVLSRVLHPQPEHPHLRGNGGGRVGARRARGGARGAREGAREGAPVSSALGV